MGYTKIIQYGQFTELRTYEKNANKEKKRNLHRKRTRRKSGATFFRSHTSIQRARQNFYRLVEANLSTKGIPTFITLTFIEEFDLNIAYENLRKFFSLIKKHYREVHHITVPEFQKNNSVHFHSLVWGIESERVRNERTSRFFQRLWARGFVDVSIAKNNSSRIAGYLTKYMQKTYSDRRLNNRRAYTHSNKITKQFVYGSDNLFSYLSEFIDIDDKVISSVQYKTKYLGDCYKIIYKNER